ncbi:MAG: acetamidase/formamidase family protein [Cyclobacteriaceae bacterium]
MKYLLTFLSFIIGLTVAGQPKSVSYQPTTFYNNFSHKVAPVTRIAQGDTLVSESVDAAGYDKTGVRVAKRGNPVTGPFYIEGAQPGDIIAITLTNVSINRDYAITVETFVPRSMPMNIIKPVYAKNAIGIKWTLDTINGYATPQTTYEHIKNLKVPLHPFMGCVAVAAPTKSKEPLTYFADQYGGNMDFSKITTGATVYLPVFHEGGLIYMGDGHASQGDGEINGDALETSMDFAFVARVIKGESTLSFPRVEDAEYIASMGMDKTLEGALKNATLGLYEWVKKDYNLTLSEATQVIGPSIEYRIPTLAGPKLEVAAMIKKEILMQLTK